MRVLLIAAPHTCWQGTVDVVRELSGQNKRFLNVLARCSLVVMTMSCHVMRKQSHEPLLHHCRGIQLTIPLRGLDCKIHRASSANSGTLREIFVEVATPQLDVQQCFISDCLVFAPRNESIKERSSNYTRD